MKRIIAVLVVLSLIILPGLAAAQAPEKAPVAPAAPQAAPAQPEAQPQAQTPPPCQPGPGGTCPMMTPEQMKQMQGKMGQCCNMQPGQCCPKCQQVQKQLDDLQKRVEALEKAKGKKK